MGHLRLAGFTLEGASPDWVVIHIAKGGALTFEPATPYMGKGNFEVAAMLIETYGKRVSLAICGPVGEYAGLLAGIAVADREGVTRKEGMFLAETGITIIDCPLAGAVEAIVGG